MANRQRPVSQVAELAIRDRRTARRAAPEPLADARLGWLGTGIRTASDKRPRWQDYRNLRNDFAPTCRRKRARIVRPAYSTCAPVMLQRYVSAEMFDATFFRDQLP